MSKLRKTDLSPNDPVEAYIAMFLINVCLNLLLIVSVPIIGICHIIGCTMFVFIFVIYIIFTVFYFSDNVFKIIKEYKGDPFLYVGP
jgi:uncharacterized Tic20 family protein